MNGQLFRGSRHAAGEVGHFMLDRTALDRRCPGFGFFESVAARAGNPPQGDQPVEPSVGLV